MKFLVLALCVCVAAAAPPRLGAQPWQQTKAFAKASVSPVAAVAKAVVQPVAVAKVSSGSDAEAVILRSEADVKADGFNYVYETGNGISAQATGSLKNVENVEVLVEQGSYSYTAPDGTVVQLTYNADENGFQPQSDLLPTPPPVPIAIQRSLEFIAAHPQPQEVVIAKKF